MSYLVDVDRFRMTVFSTENYIEKFARDVREGLSRQRKSLPCIYFYDEKGSQLFEAICDLPEYYLTRKETEILNKKASFIAGMFKENPELIELGSGSSRKTRILIEAFIERFGEAYYCPIDISPTILEESMQILLETYDNLEIEAVAGLYEEGLAHLSLDESRPKLIFWLGSSIGNYDQDNALDFLRNITGTMREKDRLLIGMDLQKERSVLERAYDDSQGVTADFNLNILDNINRELNAGFDTDTFRHYSIYNEEKNRIEMYLKSTRKQEVCIADLDLRIRFNKNELIHTENSHKYCDEDIMKIARSCDLMLIEQLYDSQRYFSLNIFRPLF